MSCDVPQELGKLLTRTERLEGDSIDVQLHIMELQEDKAGLQKELEERTREHMKKVMELESERDSRVAGLMEQLTLLQQAVTEVRLKPLLISKLPILSSSFSHFFISCLHSFLYPLCPQPALSHTLPHTIMPSLIPSLIPSCPLSYPHVLHHTLMSSLMSSLIPSCPPSYLHVLPHTLPHTLMPSLIPPCSCRRTN